MSTKRDYYEILGIDKKASVDDIKSAYRKLAMQYHPDKNRSQDAEDKFKEMSEAYAVLSDQNKRQQYDQFGHLGIDQKYSQSDIFRGVNFEDIFRDLGMAGGSFGNGIESIFNLFFRGREKRQEGVYRGQDLFHGLAINLEDAASGKTMMIEVPRTEICETCHGVGAKPGTYPKMCVVCRGSGQVSTTQNTPFGRFMTTSPCGTCRGGGKIIESLCITCNGGGTVNKMRKLEVKIPPGVDNGSRLRILGEGELGKNDGPPGDLYIGINVNHHNIFSRHGDDLVMEAPVSFTQAALGDKIIVKTLDGNVEMTIPPGTQNGHMFRLKDKGMPGLAISKRGDQVVRIKVVVPTKLTDKQRDLLREFEKV